MLCPDERLGDLAALNFSGRGAGDDGRDEDLLGALKLRQALLAVRQYVRFVRRLLEDYCRSHFFAPTRMGNAETDSFGYCGVAEEDFVNLPWTDLFATPIDEFLEAAG